MFNTRSLTPTTQKSADSSTYWQFFYYRPPGKFRYRSLKTSCQELDIYRYKQFHNQYGFSIPIGNTSSKGSTCLGNGLVPNRYHAWNDGYVLQCCMVSLIHTELKVSVVCSHPTWSSWGPPFLLWASSCADHRWQTHLRCCRHSSGYWVTAPPLAARTPHATHPQRHPTTSHRLSCTKTNQWLNSLSPGGSLIIL